MPLNQFFCFYKNFDLVFLSMTDVHIQSYFLSPNWPRKHKMWPCIFSLFYCHTVLNTYVQWNNINFDLLQLIFQKWQNTSTILLQTLKPFIYEKIVLVESCKLWLWQYGLWSFQTGVTKLKRFLPKNQHTQRKILNSEG